MNKHFIGGTHVAFTLAKGKSLTKADVAAALKTRNLKLETFDHFSSRNISPHGLSLAIEYLRERKRRAGDRQPVATLGRSVAHADLERDAVVFRIAPRRPPLLLMREALWRKGGGDGDGGDFGDDLGGGKAEALPSLDRSWLAFTQADAEVR